MSERLKEHDWKSCVLAKTGTEGSNPSLSAIKIRVKRENAGNVPSLLPCAYDMDLKVAGPCAT